MPQKYPLAGRIDCVAATGEGLNLHQLKRPMQGAQAGTGDLWKRRFRMIDYPCSSWEVFD